MSRALSIHIGVNRPQEPTRFAQLEHSENAAWQMAELAHQSGYQSHLVLLGETATRQAVTLALAAASQMLRGGDALFVSFSGHGGQEPDRDMEWGEGGFDESWRLYDGPLLDDALEGHWRLFEEGVRIVVVSESCYSGGMDRGEPRVVEPPADARSIRASVLMLTASTEAREAQDGLFTRCLREVWDAGFTGSYAALFERVSEKMMAAEARREPVIRPLGMKDPSFAAGPAFRLRPPDPDTTYRGDRGGRS